MLTGETVSRTKSAVFVVVLFLVSVWSATSGAQNTGHWVSAWSAAPQALFRFPGAPAPPSFASRTIRMIVRPTIGGEHVRIRFSNAFGSKALSIAAAHIALVSEGSRIVTESDQVLMFNGKRSVSIPPAAPILSDPVDLRFPALAEIAVSISVSDETEPTIHFWWQHPTYISGPGDFTAAADIPNPTVTNSWYWLSAVEVLAPEQTVATVAFGDSITDGAGVKQGDYADWPDALANRLASQKNLPPMSVDNEGIGGNRILHDGAGVSALARFDRDVLSQPGVANLIVLEGINDIGWPHMKPFPSKPGEPPRENPFAHEVVSAGDIIGGLHQIIERAHQHGIRVFGATLTPYVGAGYFSPDGEKTREAVNQWIRTSGEFDGVFDFEKAVRDPQRPNQWREDYQSGDHLHPSAAGYKAMADAIDLAALRRATDNSTKKK
jgi:lysophospholipase L1-like esterase